MNLVIGYLYPELMNIYGDIGNILALEKRCLWRGIKVEITHISIGDQLKPGVCDLFFFGGGQDQAQAQVAYDLEKNSKGKLLREEIERGVPLLAICGGYQLLGEYYQPAIGPKLPGVGIFPAYTVASHDRMIGNIVIQPTIPNSKYQIPYLVGFENHSGKTHLKKVGQPLGKIIKGFGNNGKDQAEGCVFKNSIGCYIHGSLLPKNPELADWLIKKALEIKYGKEIELKPLDDTLENAAHTAALQKFS